MRSSGWIPASMKIDQNGGKLNFYFAIFILPSTKTAQLTTFVTLCQRPVATVSRRRDRVQLRGDACDWRVLVNILLGEWC